MFLILGYRHRAELTLESTHAFACAACEHVGTCRVTTTGHGAASSVLFMGMAQASQRALARARTDADAEARLLVRIRPCPACGKRAAGASRAFRLAALRDLARLLGFFVLLEALVLAMAVALHQPLGWLALAAFGVNLVLAGLFAVARYGQWLGARADVVFD